MAQINPASELLVIRTHFYDQTLHLLVEDLALRSGRKVVIAADESVAVVEVPSTVEKVSVDPAALRLPAPSDVMWRCGDYNLYPLARRYRDIERFWLIEPDVRVHTADLASFLDGTSRSADADFVTPWWVEASPQWMWHASMAPFSSRIFNCMLQISRFSRRAISVLETRRRAMTRHFLDTGSSLATWPNDEAFIGATLHEQGLTVRTFADHAPDYALAGTFTFLKPTSLKWLHDQPANQRLYHPVVEDEKFVKRANLYLSERRSSRASAADLEKDFDDVFMEQLAREGGEVAIKKIKERLLSATSAAEGAS